MPIKGEFNKIMWKIVNLAIKYIPFVNKEQACQIKSQIEDIPMGYSLVMFKGKKYGVSRKDFNNGKSIKIFAEELGGKDFISFNCYFTKITQLKPCEMSENKVMDFLANFTFEKKD